MYFEKVQEDGDSTSSKFIAVGTGKVDEDAEDSECVGRLLLFEVVDRDFEDKRFNAGESVELQLTYEKAMQMGPVTCLTNLNVDNKTRLVVGAGAEVTVEQWTGSYLLQVGFFHANMHVFHMTFMKGFLLLSDAYVFNIIVTYKYAHTYGFLLLQCQVRFSSLPSVERIRQKFDSSRQRLRAYRGLRVRYFKSWRCNGFLIA